MTLLVRLQNAVRTAIVSPARKRSDIEAPVVSTLAVVDLIFHLALAVRGEPVAARAALARADRNLRVDPVHQAIRGRLVALAADAPPPVSQLTRLERYKVDRLLFSMCDLLPRGAVAEPYSAFDESAEPPRPMQWTVRDAISDTSLLRRWRQAHQRDLASLAQLSSDDAKEVLVRLARGPIHPDEALVALSAAASLGHRPVVEPLAAVLVRWPYGDANPCIQALTGWAPEAAARLTRAFRNRRLPDVPWEDAVSAMRVLRGPDRLDSLRELARFAVARQEHEHFIGLADELLSISDSYQTNSDYCLSVCIAAHHLAGAALLEP